MPGLGRKTFAPGEVLRAADVNGYLMDQTVMNFAGTAARGSAIGTAASEGMISYQKDTDFIEIYDGSSWLPAVSPTAWTAYTPTFAGFTLGNGTVAFYYKQIGKTVFVNGNLTFGSTSAMTGPFDYSMPTAVNSRQTGLLPAGRAYYYNNSSIYSGSVLFIGGNSVRSIVDTVSGTRIINNEVSSTVPFTWANGHTYKFSLVYEAA